MPGSNEASAARILIVDDQDSNVRLLEHALRRGGFTTLTSTVDPRQVVAMHREHRYDLIILDVQMPYMSGFEVMEALRALPGVPVLVMTADPSQMVRALTAGARDFISKPFVLAEVLRHVHLILDAGASQDVEAASLRGLAAGQDQQH